MKIACLVVDDEPLARRLIASHVSKIETLELSGECSNAIDAGNFLRTRKVDLIFLDIQMPEISGVQFVGTLKNPPAIIFTTAFRDFAPEAFDLDVIDYLLKPVSFDRFTKAVNKFFDRRDALLNEAVQISPSDNFIYIKSDRRTHKILLDDVIFVESLDDYVKVHLSNEVLVTRENITSFDQKLPSSLFVRIHRSYIINMRRINSIGPEGVDIAKKKLPFGRAFKKSAMAAMSLKN